MIDKDLLKNSLTIDQIFQIVSKFGGNPTYAKNGLISDTICHNQPGQGSHKLYYYEDSKTFHCYTGDCGNFDIYELVKRVFKIQKNQDLEFSACLYFVANFFNINDFTFAFDSAENIAPKNELIDFLDRVEQWRPTEKVILKEYDGTILKNLPCYRIKDWEKEGIKYGTLKKYEIRFYSPSKKIVIPHRDINGRLIGIRGRALSDFDIENFGKYMPLYLTNGESFAHPLGYNLYGLYKTKKNISKMKKAIIFEGEKSVMKLDSYIKNNFSVAACGSNISSYQINLLLELGVEEIIIAFDKQYKRYCDKEYHEWFNKLKKISDRYKNYVRMTFTFDKNDLLEYKDSPIDKGYDTFLKILDKRIEI